MDPEWQLSQQFTFDGNGIRCAAVLEGGKIVCGTQSGMLYEIDSAKEDFSQVSNQPHNHSITAMIPNSDGTSYITGCKDNAVRVLDGNTHQVLHELTGHEKAVTSLSRCGNYLLSGSWDGTAKVWLPSEKKLIATLSGHENTVSVCGLSVDKDVLTIATGSAGVAENNSIRNHSVRIWTVNTVTGQTEMTQKVSNDHDGPIRGLCLLKSNGLLASCSNDGTVKLRDASTGTCLSTLTSSVTGEMPMLLHVCPSGDTGMAVAAEDGHLLVWQNLDGTAPQAIPHPSCVWTVTQMLSTGDLITCCQDGYLRIFTQSTDRIAPESVRQQWESDLQKKASGKGPSKEEVAKLPRWELNGLQQGKSEGQVQLFQKDGIAIAAQWSAASQTWIEVGQVMGSAGDQQQIDGVSYDHVLPIEVDTTGGGVAKLQIGYNNGENPFVAAQRFMDAHMLPQHHLQEIANYIQQRTGGNNTPTIGMDTGGGGAGGASPLPMLNHFPNKVYKSFGITKTTNFDKVLGKVKEGGSLSDEEMGHLQSLCTTLAETSRYHASKLPPEAATVLTRILTEFSEAFPALDLLRYAALHPDSTAYNWSNLLLLAKGLASKSDAPTAVQMLTLRLYANCFVNMPSQITLEDALQLTEKCASSGNKNVRLSVATLWMNIATFLHKNPASSLGSSLDANMISQIRSIITTKTYESEAMTRLLWALGTLLVARTQTAKEAVSSHGMWSLVEMAASPHGDMAKQLAKEIYRIQNPSMI